MRLRINLVLIALSLLVPDFVRAKTDSPELYAFYGDVIAIDLAAHTITIKSGGKRLVFRITDETKISGRNRYVTLDKVKPGDGATVLMKLGEGNQGIAVRIRFDTEENLSKSLKLYVARTVNAGVVSGMAVNNFIAYQPPADGFMGGPSFGTERSYRDGMFLLVVQRDGSVSNVKMIKSLGFNELNVRAIKWLKKWRFHPNSVTEVQMPINYTETRY